MRIKKIAAAALIIIIALCFLTACTADNEGTVVADKCMPSLLEISCEFQASSSSGTAIIVDERGYAVTNAHVVVNQLGTAYYTALTVTGRFYNSREAYVMEIVSYDTVKDIAVLKFERNDIAIKGAYVKENSEPEYGETVYAIGNAIGYGLSITKGIVSAPIRFFNDSANGYVGQYIQFDAAVNSGASGGALIDAKARVIGMITFRIKTGSVYADGIGFAIPASIFMAYFRSEIK